MAAAYHHRPPTAASLERARAAAVEASLSSGDRALDVGGGPGYHAEQWAIQGVQAVVLDPTPAMLAAASDREGVSVVGGIAQQLPFRNGTFALVYFHLSIHYGDWRASVAEAQRVAAPGGTVFVWTMSRAHHTTSIYAEWFPAAVAFDLERFPEPADLTTHMLRCGLVDVRAMVTYEKKPRYVGEFETQVRDRFISSLHALSDDELEAGLAGFRARYPDKTVRIESTLRFDRVVGRKP